MAGRPRIVGGVDTHADTMHVAVLTLVGRKLADQEFPTTGSGYRSAIGFLTGHGAVEAVGVEGTSSYGAGFTKALITAGMRVIEVNRPNRAARRRRGKSDPVDAELAARAVLSGDATSAPKDPAIEAIRALFNARRSAVKARTAASNQITSLQVTAPEPLRAKYRSMKGDSLIAALASSCRPSSSDMIADAVLSALKVLAERHHFLTTQAADLLKQIDVLVSAANPALRAAFGVGPDTAAQLLITAGANPGRLRSEPSFAALCGVAPVQASSGKTNRHRLSRGGDRGANNALYRIALVRMSNQPCTKEYVARQVAAHRTKAAIIRLLKRAIVREIYRLLTKEVEIPEYRDLRPSRQAKNITLTTVANHFEVWPMVISCIERGTRRDDALAINYRKWLSTA